MSTTTAGTIMAISLVAPATLDLAGYTTLYPSMNDIGEITDMGEYDRVYTLVTTIPLAQRRVKKFKGSYDEGSMSTTFDIEPADVGQVDLNTAKLSDDDAYFAVTHQDGTVDFFSAKVMSASKVVGSADQMYSSNSTIEINSDIIESPIIP